ncbi:CLUMA_CG011687, isoform A [Clunio marinus]|uniref:CLUMA_CG011687, isoform A n=1 Tax=Clunio marinus TaxID=568069 RepID=A0A1J1IDI0_9DIPT|nr:CLUMA_CG011687, isoform A [Clunio marinus]
MICVKKVSGFQKTRNLIKPNFSFTSNNVKAFKQLHMKIYFKMKLFYASFTDKHVLHTLQIKVFKFINRKSYENFEGMKNSGTSSKAQMANLLLMD